MAPSSVLLPTPLPPKMPMRWPFAAGQQAVDGADAGDQRLRDVRAARADSAAAGKGGSIHPDRWRDRRPSAAEAIEHAPEQLRPDVHRCVAWARASTQSPRCRPSVSSSGMERHAAVAKPDHLGADARPPAVRISQKSPTAAAGPRDSMSRPTSSRHLTRALKRVEALDIGEVAAKSMAVRLGMSFATHPIRQTPLDFFKLRVDGGVELAAIGLEQYRTQLAAWRRATTSTCRSGPASNCFERRPPATG